MAATAAMAVTEEVSKAAVAVATAATELTEGMAPEVEATALQAIKLAAVVMVLITTVMAAIAMEQELLVSA